MDVFILSIFRNKKVETQNCFEIKILVILKEIIAFEMNLPFIYKITIVKVLMIIRTLDLPFYPLQNAGRDNILQNENFK